MAVKEKMGGLRKSGWTLICIYVSVVAFTLRFTTGSEESASREEQSSSILIHSDGKVAAERKAAEFSVETANKNAAAEIPARLDTEHAQRQGGTITNKGIMGGRGPPKAPSLRVASLAVGNNENLSTGCHKLSFNLAKHVPSDAARSSAPQLSSKQVAQPSHGLIWGAHSLKRLKRRSEFGNAVAAYAKHLMSRALNAGHEVIDLLETVEGLSQERASLLLKLLRTWPDITRLLKRYEHYKIQSLEQLLSSLVQYRARATELATRPRPRIFASRAIKAYIDVGEPIFHDVMAAFLFSVIRDEPTRLRYFREFYLPMLQVSLSASALMLYNVPSRHSRDCLEVIERRIVQLEHLGRVTRTVQQTWAKLAVTAVVGVS